MNFEFNDDQVAFRDMAASFAANEIAPYAAKWDRQRTFPREMLQKAAQNGMAGLYVREEFGGSGLTRIGTALPENPPAS